MSHVVLAQSAATQYHINFIQINLALAYSYDTLSHFK